MNLLINEFVKDYKKRSTYIYIVVLLGFTYFIEWYSQKTTTDFDPYDFLTVILKNSSQMALIFALVMLANNISQEFSKGTVKFLYSVPKSILEYRPLLPNLSWRILLRAMFWQIAT